MKIFRVVSHKRTLLGFKRSFSTEPELKDFLNYLDNLKNYEKCGVPKDAGTDSSHGFDLGRMNRLMDWLGNPQTGFKVRAFFQCYLHSNILLVFSHGAF